MFESDLLLAFIFMALLFLRQISIIKQPNKLNYAPLMVAIGAVGSVVHFIIHPEINDVILLIRESMLPLLVSLLLYIIMNILHQTQQTQNSQKQEEFEKVLVSQVTKMKEYMVELEDRMIKNQEEDRQAQEDVREKFVHDIKALDAIQVNQGKFLEKFDEMGALHNSVSNAIEHFSNTQLPELDNVVHKHIDILRISEQDHHNKIKIILTNAIDSRGDISEDIIELKNTLNSMSNVSNTIAKDIAKHTINELSGVTQAFESQILSLKSHTESVITSLYEGENTLSAIREQSEMIMKQMLLSSNKMNELESKNDGLHDVYSVIKELMYDIEIIKADYVKSQSQLSTIARDFKNSEDEQINTMKTQVETLSNTLSQKIDESLEKLHEHYHIADDNITQSVQVLAKKAQLKNGYSQLDS